MSPTKAAISRPPGATETLLFLVKTPASRNSVRARDTSAALAKSHAASVFHQRRRAEQLLQQSQSHEEPQFVFGYNVSSARDRQEQPTSVIIKRKSKLKMAYSGPCVVVPTREVSNDHGRTGQEPSSAAAFSKAHSEVTPLGRPIDLLPGLPHQKSSGFAGAMDFCMS